MMSKNSASIKYELIDSVASSLKGSFIYFSRKKKERFIKILTIQKGLKVISLYFYNVSIKK